MNKARQLLGKKVKVTLDEKVIVEGQLLSIGEYGDLVIVVHPTILLTFITVGGCFDIEEAT